VRLHGEDGHCADPDRVAIRLRLRDLRVADGAGGAGAIDDHHGARKRPLHRLRERARHGIHGAAGGERTDERDRALGVLRGSDADEQEDGDDGGGRRRTTSAH
jgi:hypothetical protein